MERFDEKHVTEHTSSRNIPITDIEKNIVQTAIARNPFFEFASLKQYFPQLASMQEFRTSKDYLAGLKITFKGDLSQLEDNPAEKLTACCDLLDKIKTELLEQITKYEGTKGFYREQIHTIFTDKTLKLDGNSPRADENHPAENLVKNAEWYAFSGLYDTSEEKPSWNLYKHTLMNWKKPTKAST